MAYYLNTNRQFMAGNDILVFAVVFVVVISIYMSLRLQRGNQTERYYIETYTISLVKGFAGDSISPLVNDSLIASQVMQREVFMVEVDWFVEQSAPMVADDKTEIASALDLSEEGGTYQFEKEMGGIKQLAKQEFA